MTASSRQQPAKIGALVPVARARTNSHAMDATGLVALEGTMHPILKAHGTIILAGVCEQPMKVLTKAGLHQRPGILFAANPRAALEFAPIQLRI